MDQLEPFAAMPRLKSKETLIVIRQILLLTILIIPSLLHAQQIVSVRSGIIQFVKGEVFLDDKHAQIPPNGYLQMSAGQRLITRGGLVELQLSPGAYLRLGEGSAARMIENRLGKTRLQLEQGSALVESVDGSAINPILVELSGAEVRIERDGLYRLDAIPGDVKVHSGETAVSKNGRTRIVKTGRMIRLDGDRAEEKFDASGADSLHQWSARRSFDLFNLTPETRKQMHWVPTSAGWVWNSAFHTSYYSELFYLKWIKDEANQKIQELRNRYERDSQLRTVNGSEYEALLSEIREAQLAIQKADQKAKQLDASASKPQFR